MQPKISIISSVKNGKLNRNRKKIADVIEKFEGKDIEIIICKKRKTRSLSQNGYYFGVIVTLFQEAIRDLWGEIWSKEKVHEFLKNRFLFNEQINEDTGEVYKTPKSTTECTTTEIEDYYEECRRFALEDFGVAIPLPNEEVTINFD